MKVNTISLNSVRLNTIALNHIGEIRSGGGGPKPSPIPQWIREHVVFYYDVKKQGATNETLKESAYLQDLSGKGRRMKLNNFLFAAMSGVGGYETNFFNTSIWERHGNVINDHTFNPRLKGSTSDLYTAGLIRVNFKATVTGMKSGYRLEFGYGNIAPSDKSIYEDGEYEFSSDTNNIYGFKLYADDGDYSNPNTDVIIELKEVYPNALVTDGVDDYGLVENLSSGVKMLFMTVNPIGSLNANKTYYTQGGLNKPFWVSASINSIAYNNNNPNGITYIDGVLNESVKPENLFNIKHIITIVNGTVNSANSKQPAFFSNEHHSGYFPKLAFYNSIAFDSIPTEADGFTEQELIDYVLTNIIGQ